MSSTTRKNMTIYAGDQKFKLNEAELQSEPDCIFMEYFRDNNMPDLNADAYLFGLNHDHLKGYEIFPLPSQGFPYGGGSFVGESAARTLPYLSKEATLKNLLRDATDFGLKNLVTKIEREMANQLESSRRAERLDDDPEAMKGFVILDSV